MSPSNGIAVSWDSRTYLLTYNEGSNKIIVGNALAASHWTPSITYRSHSVVVISFINANASSVRHVALDDHDMSLSTTEAIYDASEVELVDTGSSHLKLLALHDTALSSGGKMVMFCEHVDGNIRFVSNAKSVEYELQGRGYRVFLNLPETDWFDSDLSSSSSGWSCFPFSCAEGVIPRNFKSLHVPQNGQIGGLSKQHLDVIMLRLMCTLRQLGGLQASFGAIKIGRRGYIINPGAIVGQPASNMGYTPMLRTFMQTISNIGVRNLVDAEAFMSNLDLLRSVMDRLVYLRALELDPSTSSYIGHYAVACALTSVVDALTLLYHRFL